jgi:hypothetical protein
MDRPILIIAGFAVVILISLVAFAVYNTESLMNLVKTNYKAVNTQCGHSQGNSCITSKDCTDPTTEECFRNVCTPRAPDSSGATAGCSGNNCMHEVLSLTSAADVLNPKKFRMYIGSVQPPADQRGKVNSEGKYAGNLFEEPKSQTSLRTTQSASEMYGVKRAMYSLPLISADKFATTNPMMSNVGKDLYMNIAPAQQEQTTDQTSGHTSYLNDLVANVSQPDIQADLSSNNVFGSDATASASNYMAGAMNSETLVYDSSIPIPSRKETVNYVTIGAACVPPINTGASMDFVTSNTFGAAGGNDKTPLGGSDGMQNPLRFYSPSAIRIESAATLDVINNDYIVVLDALQIPSGCGTWPAFWLAGTHSKGLWQSGENFMFDHRWPQNGEIDIMEQVNTTDPQKAVNYVTMHTSSVQTGDGRFDDNDCKANVLGDGKTGRQGPLNYTPSTCSSSTKIPRVTTDEGTVSEPFASRSYDYMADSGCGTSMKVNQADAGMTAEEADAYKRKTLMGHALPGVSINGGVYVAHIRRARDLQGTGDASTRKMGSITVYFLSRQKKDQNDAITTLLAGSNKADSADIWDDFARGLKTLNVPFTSHYFGGPKNRVVDFETAPEMKVQDDNTCGDSYFKDMRLIINLAIGGNFPASNMSSVSCSINAAKYFEGAIAENSKMKGTLLANNRCYSSITKTDLWKQTRTFAVNYNTGKFNFHNTEGPKNGVEPIDSNGALTVPSTGGPVSLKMLNPRYSRLSDNVMFERTNTMYSQDPWFDAMTNKVVDGVEGCTRYKEPECESQRKVQTLYFNFDNKRVFYTTKLIIGGHITQNLGEEKAIGTIFKIEGKVAQCEVEIELDVGSPLFNICSTVKGAVSPNPISLGDNDITANVIGPFKPSSSAPNGFSYFFPGCDVGNKVKEFPSYCEWDGKNNTCGDIFDPLIRQGLCNPFDLPGTGAINFPVNGGFAHIVSPDDPLFGANCKDLQDKEACIYNDFCSWTPSTGSGSGSGSGTCSQASQSKYSPNNVPEAAANKNSREMWDATMSAPSAVTQSQQSTWALNRAFGHSCLLVNSDMAANITECLGQTENVANTMCKTLYQNASAGQCVDGLRENCIFCNTINEGKLKNPSKLEWLDPSSSMGSHCVVPCTTNDECKTQSSDSLCKDGYCEPKNKNFGVSGAMDSGSLWYKPMEWKLRNVKVFRLDTGGD